MLVAPTRHATRDGLIRSSALWIRVGGNPAATALLTGQLSAIASPMWSGPDAAATWFLIKSRPSNEQDRGTRRASRSPGMQCPRGISDSKRQSQKSLIALRVTSGHAVNRSRSWAYALTRTTVFDHRSDS